MRIDLKDLSLLAITILLNVIGQLAMKKGMTAVGVVTLDPARFVATMGRTWAALKEDVPLLRWLGVLVICAGVYLVGRS